jgi:uncharacterized protein YhaN
MRIDRLDLIAYGRFSEKTLDLAAGSCGLHLIYGNNEAGKSTSLRALIAWLFGIPARTRDSFRHAHQQLRVGGRLRLTDGRTLDFVRRKGIKGTLLRYGSEEPLDDAVLQPFLPGGIDEKLFSTLWGIDHPRLVAGGQELLDQSGDLGQALFSAAVGTAGLRRVLNELQNGADQLFKPRAPTKMVNQAIAEFKAAQKMIKEASLPVTEWKRLQQELTETLLAIDQVEQTLAARGREKSRLDRLKRVGGALAERRAVRQRIDALGEVPSLPADFAQQQRATRERLAQAEAARNRAVVKIGVLEQEADALVVRQELLDNEEAILDLYRESGAVEKTIEDRPQQDGKRRLLRNEAETLLKGVRPDVDLADADALRPLLNHKKWLTGLARQYSLLEQKKAQVTAALRDIADQRQALQRELATQPAAQLDLGGLKATIAAARKAGDLEQRLAELRRRAAAEHAACSAELARLGRFSGTAAALLELALPVPETLDSNEKSEDELAEQLRNLQRRQEEVNEQHKLAEEELHSLLLSGPVPMPVELEESRRLRDTGWQLVKDQYIEQRDVAGEIAAFTGGADLPSLYEQKVEQADQLADRLRQAADKVVKRADLEARLANHASRLAAIAAEIARVTAARQEQEMSWRMVWEPLNIVPGTAREMKQWILRVEKLVARIQSANTVVDDQQALADEVRRLQESVARQICAFDPTAEPWQMSLEAMLSLCEQRVTDEEAARERRQQLSNQLADAEIGLHRRGEEQKGVDTDRQRWRQEWGQAIAGLGLGADVHPEQAAESFEQLVAFFDKFDRSEDLRKRIFGIDQVEKKFSRQVFAFAESLGVAWEGRQATAIVAQLHRDLTVAREARAGRGKLETQLAELKVERSDAEITISRARDQLAGLRQLAGVAGDDDLPAAGDASRRQRELVEKLEMLEQELNRNGDGLSIAELEEEAAAAERDAIDGELAKIDQELSELQAERDGLRDRRQTLQNDIQARDGNAAAATAAEEAEQKLAVVVAGAEQYLRLQIAALILEQRIEEYRRENQAPVLARAGELFARLTLDSYAGLRDELDDGGRPILLGLRANAEEVAIGAMSDGTRDQLYLALRLATLEQHLSRGEPLPFVVDDILIGFDDDRTRVCLELLAELAATTQVLLFTHHRRVVELAEKINAPAGIFTQSLGSDLVF